MFETILNWKLLDGSHDFPGPDGGTCINEAAIIASGFEYRAVEDAADCPACFSRPIAQYAIGLNDALPVALRQRLLLPFVTRLAGTRDTKAVEKSRADFILMETVKRVLPFLCARPLRRSRLAALCRAVITRDDAHFAASEVTDASYARPGIAFDEYFALEALTGAFENDVRNTSAAGAAVDVVGYSAHRTYAEPLFTVATGILDEAIKLGNHPVLDVGAVIPRLESARGPVEGACQKPARRGAIAKIAWRWPDAAFSQVTAACD